MKATTDCANFYGDIYFSKFTFTKFSESNKDWKPQVLESLLVQSLESHLEYFRVVNVGWKRFTTERLCSNTVAWTLFTGFTISQDKVNTARDTLRTDDFSQICLGFYTPKSLWFPLYILYIQPSFSRFYDLAKIGLMSEIKLSLNSTN